VLHALSPPLLVLVTGNYRLVRLTDFTIASRVSSNPDLGIP
jgi:hypothetical protein